MDTVDIILKELEKCQYKVSTDTRKDVYGSVYFALRGETFDGNLFVSDALKKGAVFAVSEKKENSGNNVCIVDDVLEMLLFR